ncbi:MAG: Na+:solute symporter [Ignavibacteria bacterium]|nr:Na+:solute symporter [Ignavibacteria bacterium]MBI3766148.1 Na+:solute symporter [Ignavibacteriales bacterium]
MHILDWAIIAVYFIASAAIGIYFTKRAGTNIQEFFLSGRNLPWWLAGTSMVATTFAADTPLAVTELVAKNGIAGNWLWWNFVFGGMLTVFFFARLWRRAGIMTDVEFVELRYSGKPAAFLRGFRSIYLGIFMNCIIIGWVNLAMAAILEGMFGIPHSQVMVYVALSLVLTAVYSAMSGLWGVAVTDAFQFALAMIGTIVLAIVVLGLPQVGGISGLQAKLPEWTMRFTPMIGESGLTQSVGGAFALSVAAFLAFVGVQWWASWYPGAEPGGGGYIAQRMMSAKDEKHSLFATLWFTIAHYCVRPWPWILVGLSTLVLYPDLAPADKKLGYVYAMRDFLPTGLKGMLVASFFAAFMSTISTQLNWGTSYVINDFYKRFVKPLADEKHLIRVSRAATIVIMIISLIVTGLLDTISGAWAFIIEAGAGLGLVLILRWFWWRINAWSEIAAMLTPLLVFAYIKNETAIQFPESLFYIVSITTVVWLLVTFLTRPVDVEVLKNFYRRVHPGGIGWKGIAQLVPDVKGDTAYAGLFLDWVAGIVLIYTMLFGVGKLILGNIGGGLAFVAIGLLSAGVIYWDLSRRGFEKVVE